MGMHIETVCVWEMESLSLVTSEIFISAADQVSAN